MLRRRYASSARSQEYVIARDSGGSDSLARCGGSYGLGYTELIGRASTGEGTQRPRTEPAVACHGGIAGAVHRTVVVDDGLIVDLISVHGDSAGV